MNAAPQTRRRPTVLLVLAAIAGVTLMIVGSQTFRSMGVWLGHRNTVAHLYERMKASSDPHDIDALSRTLKIEADSMRYWRSRLQWQSVFLAAGMLMTGTAARVHRSCRGAPPAPC